MRQVINEKDLKNIIGKFVVQLDDKDENLDFIYQNHDGFWLEKRISFVGQLDLIGNKDFLKDEYQKGNLMVLNGLYYCHGIYTPEQFVKYFNTGSPTYDDKPEGERRFYRTLTSRELDWLNKHLKTSNH